MFTNLYEIWNNWGFEIAIGISILVILILALFRIGKEGTWSTTYDYIPPSKNIKKSKGETECRRVLKQIFKRDFPSIRPSFLCNQITGGRYNLEIDCYNEELRLGVEYNGVQHYKYVPFFHRNKEAFKNQQYRDELKRIKCRENGVVLIEVPYTVGFDNIELYLTKTLHALGYIKN